MARGGFRPGAGRPKGARTKPKEDRSVKATKKAPAKKRQPAKRVVKKEAIAPPATTLATQPDPPPARPKKYATSIDFAMDAINDTNVDMADKVRLAIALMPYQAPKLAEQKQGDGKGKKAPSSKFAPPPPPGSKPKLAVSND